MSSLTIRGVPCEIAGDHDGNAGMVRRWTEYGPEITIQFMTDWGNGQNLAAALLGSVALNDDGSLSRIPPYNLPFASRLFCNSVGDERPLNPKKDSSGWVYYEKSQISATFGALTWQIDGGDSTGQIDPSGLPYTTTKFRVSNEVLSPPKGYYFVGPFGSGSKQNTDALIGYVSPRVEISMVRHWQPRVPLDSAMSLIGTVNDETIKLGDRTFPRGCLLFTGLSNDPRNDPNGYPVQELEYTFLGKFTVEWNEFLDGETQEYQFLNTKQDGSGQFPFEYVDFSELFT